MPLSGRPALGNTRFGRLFSRDHQKGFDRREMVDVDRCSRYSLLATLLFYGHLLRRLVGFVAGHERIVEDTFIHETFPLAADVIPL